MKTSRRQGSGFTLIEVLVVVAIIALLISILLPSLKRARDQAKLVTDKANSKQIATATNIYQAENKGFVPIMLNWHSGPAYNAPARSVFLSVALRSQEKALTNLKLRQSTAGPYFDPNTVWTNAMRDDYEVRFLPQHYICPFERGKQPWDLRQVRSISPHTLWEWSGVMESNQTWLWEDVIRNKRVYSEPVGWGGSPLNGLPQYSVLTWNQVSATGKSPSDTNILNRLHRKWETGDVRKRSGGSLSMMTVLYCAIGEHLELGSRRIDVGSHVSNGVGGTIAVFADSHVDWVRGTRIGWP